LAGSNECLGARLRRRPRPVRPQPHRLPGVTREAAAVAHGITARVVATVVGSIRAATVTRKRAPDGIAVIVIAAIVIVVIGVKSASGRMAGSAIANAIRSAGRASALPNALANAEQSGRVRADRSGTSTVPAVNQALRATKLQAAQRMIWVTALKAVPAPRLARTDPDWNAASALTGAKGAKGAKGAREAKEVNAVADGVGVVAGAAVAAAARIPGGTLTGRTVLPPAQGMKPTTGVPR
jgi:hypothetical protein